MRLDKDLSDIPADDLAWMDEFLRSMCLAITEEAVTLARAIKESTGLWVFPIFYDQDQGDNCYCFTVEGQMIYIHTNVRPGHPRGKLSVMQTLDRTMICEIPQPQQTDPGFGPAQMKG